MPSLKHTHRYERDTYGKNGYIIYKCVLPGCSHYVSKELALNKEGLCSSCENKILITKTMIHNDVRYPRCEKCKLEKEMLKEELNYTVFN